MTTEEKKLIQDAMYLITEVMDTYDERDDAIVNRWLSDYRRLIKGEDNVKL